MSGRILRKLPWFSFFLVGSTLALETATHFDPNLFGTLQRHLSLDWSSLEKFEVYRVLTSPFLQTSPGFSRTILGLTAIVVPVFELRAGTIRTIATFFVGDCLSTLPILAALKLAAAFGNETAIRLAIEPDSGSSSGGFACLGAMTVMMPGKYRLASLFGLAMFFAVRLAIWHRLFDFQHALAAVVGIAGSYLWTKRSPPTRSGPGISTEPETA